MRRAATIIAKVVVAAAFVPASCVACTIVTAGPAAVVPKVPADFAVVVKAWKQPAAGVVVRLIKDGREETAQVSNEAGRVELTGLATGHYQVHVSRPVERFVDIEVVPKSEAKLREVWVTWEGGLQARRIAGEFAGAASEVLVLMNGTSGAELARGHTSDNGRFDLGPFPPGKYVLRVTDTRSAGNVGDIPLEISEEAKQADLDIAIGWTSCGLWYGDGSRCKLDPVELSRPAGVVVDPYGAAIAGTVIKLFANDDATGEAVARTRADESGAWDFGSVATGRYLLALAAPAFTPSRVPIVISVLGTNVRERLQVRLGLMGACSKVKRVAVNK